VNPFSLPFIRIHREVTSRHTSWLWLLIALMVGLFLQAYMHNFNIVYITLFVLFGVASSSCFFGRLNLFYLEASPLPPGRIFAKSASLLRWQIHNRSDQTRYDLVLTCNDVSVTLKALEQSAIVTLPMVFETRGMQTIDTLKVTSSFPMPHVRFLKTLLPSERCIVYPAPEGLPLEQRFRAHEALQGERHDFEGLRRHDSSDALSLIHWPSLAKGGELLSRRYSFIQPNTLLHFDFKTAGESDEARLSQLCLWVLECEKSGRPFTLSMPQQHFDSAKEGIDAILTALALY